MNFIKGRPMRFLFDDFLFLYVYSGEVFRPVSKLVLECNRLLFSIHNLRTGADDDSRFGKMTGYFAKADRKSFPI